jgi:hypothetical protein
VNGGQLPAYGGSARCQGIASLGPTCRGVPSASRLSPRNDRERQKTTDTKTVVPQGKSASPGTSRNPREEIPKPGVVGSIPTGGAVRFVQFRIPYCGYFGHSLARTVNQAVTEEVPKGGERPRPPQISERESLDFRTCQGTSIGRFGDVASYPPRNLRPNTRVEHDASCHNGFVVALIEATGPDARLPALSAP